MDVVLIVAIVRSVSLEEAERTLQRLGVRGITVSKAKGYGEYANFFSHDHLTDQVKIEVFVPRQRSQAVVDGLLKATHTGTPGDGIVAVVPVEAVVSVRTGAPAIPNSMPA